LARCLFDEVWIDGKGVLEVQPQPEFEPFFRLNYEAFLAERVTESNELATPKGLGALLRYLKENGYSVERRMPNRRA